MDNNNLIELHTQVKKHKFRITRNTAYAKSYGDLLDKMIRCFYETTKHNNRNMEFYLHEALSLAWHFYTGDKTYAKYYKDGAEMDKDVMFAMELIIGDIHKYIKNNDLDKLHLYYTGSNFKGTRKSVLLWNGKEYEQKKGW